MAKSDDGISPGEVIEDPLFGQRYRFSLLEGVLRIETWVDPGGGVLVKHLHPRIEERFELLQGEVTFRLDGRKVRLGPGEKLVVAPGERHSFENTGRAIAHLVSEAEPALDLEESIAGAITMADGLARRGFPKSPGALLEAIEFAERHRETTRLAFPPQVVQRLLFPTLARLGRRRPERASSR